MQYPKRKPIRLRGKKYKELQLYVLERDKYTCQNCGQYTQAPPHHKILRSQSGDDSEFNLITLCQICHAAEHGITIKSV
jgi:5-methylcytosine-specific restriction endonuclease McrA